MDKTSKWKHILDKCECGEGWFALICDALDEIEAIYREKNMNMIEDFKILQIKQKIGKLVIYANYDLCLKELVGQVIQKYQKNSLEACEECGSNGRIYQVESCWISTLCKKCIRDYTGDGFKFIEQTLEEKGIDISQHIWKELANSTTGYGPGWHELIIKMIEDIDLIYKKNHADASEFKINEIKEKYGRLQVYVESKLQDVYSLILQVENRSETVCSECGALSGGLYKNGDWFETLCAKCALEQGYTKVRSEKDES